MKEPVMRNNAFLFIVPATLCCWTAGAWAQSAPTNLPVPKAELALNNWDSPGKYQLSINSASKSGLERNDINTKGGPGGNANSPASTLSESIRAAVQVPATNAASKVAVLQELKAPNAGADLAVQRSSVKPELNQR
jgi:hypothetical protein